MSGWMIGDRGLIPDRDWGFFSSPPQPDRLWESHNPNPMDNENFAPRLELSVVCPCIFKYEDGGSMFLWSVGTSLQAPHIVTTQKINTYLYRRDNLKSHHAIPWTHAHIRDVFIWLRHWRKSAWRRIAERCFLRNVPCSCRFVRPNFRPASQRNPWHVTTRTSIWAWLKFRVWSHSLRRLPPLWSATHNDADQRIFKAVRYKVLHGYTSISFASHPPTTSFSESVSLSFYCNILWNGLNFRVISYSTMEYIFTAVCMIFLFLLTLRGVSDIRVW